MYFCFALYLHVHIVLIAFRGMMDENNEQFVAYFLPTEETAQKRKNDEKLQLLYQDEE